MRYLVDDLCDQVKTKLLSQFLSLVLTEMVQIGCHKCYLDLVKIYLAFMKTLTEGYIENETVFVWSLLERLFEIAKTQ